MDSRKKYILPALCVSGIFLFIQATSVGSFESLVKKFTREHKIAALDESRITGNKEIISLGKSLFSDKRLSRNQNIACSSCHIEEKGFSNGEAFSSGTHGNTSVRHVPHLYNLAWQNNFFWDGRSASLEDQLKKVIGSKNELDMSLDEIVDRLQSDENLRSIFEKTFPGQGISKKTIQTSLIQYELSLSSGKSAYDRYLEGDSTAISKIQVKGLQLFISKANCISCHFGQNLSDGLFHNVGVITEDKGRHLIDKVGMANEFESRPYPFFSNFKAFKTPTLRNLSRTAPYFHNGSKKTIREVLDFYNKGGDNSDRTGVAKEIKPLQLSEEELIALEAFLESLTGY